MDHLLAGLDRSNDIGTSGRFSYHQASLGWELLAKFIQQAEVRLVENIRMAGLSFNRQVDIARARHHSRRWWGVMS